MNHYQNLVLIINMSLIIKSTHQLILNIYLIALFDKGVTGSLSKNSLFIHSEDHNL